MYSLAAGAGYCGGGKICTGAPRKCRLLGLTGPFV